jgi:hypothetical protein
MCYTPGRHVLAHAQQIGYQVRQRYRMDNSTTWVELQRPGTLSSLRGGQSLAKVVYKDEYYHYTKEQIESVKQQALDLNIATAEELNKMTVRQIVELTKQQNSEHTYTEEQIKIIKKHACDLNIATLEELNNMLIRNIVELIKQRTNK